MMNRVTKNLLISTCIAMGAGAMSAAWAGSPAFEVPDSPLIKRHFNFWVRIYSEIPTTQGLIHDTLYVDRIHEVIDVSGLTRQQEKKRINQAKEKWRAVLLSVHQKRATPEKMNDEERRLFQMYADLDRPNKYLEARQKKRIRFQLGQKDRFAEAVKISGAYLKRMEAIFDKYDIPKEITRLPFVESSFNIYAQSKVGASGIWQFIRSTGKKYLNITDQIDERNDPLLATEAAAKLLRENYAALGSWPLALIAYNHGRKGMMRAVRKVGSTDVDKIIGEYSTGSFGFASRNFLMEFMAAVEVEKRASHYFGDVERLTPVEYTEVGLADAVAPATLIKHLDLDAAELKKLNPAISRSVWKGNGRIPARYRLKIPAQWGKESSSPQEAFWTGYQKIPAKLKHRQPHVRVTDKQQES